VCVCVNHQRSEGDVTIRADDWKKPFWDHQEAVRESAYEVAYTLHEIDLQSQEQMQEVHACVCVCVCI
jgi:hypothetical protein